MAVRVDKSKMGKENDKKFTIFQRFCISVILSCPFAGMLVFLYLIHAFFSVGN
jgi:hypothetical protein